MVGLSNAEQKIVTTVDDFVFFSIFFQFHKVQIVELFEIFRRYLMEPKQSVTFISFSQFNWYELKNDRSFVTCIGNAFEIKLMSEVFEIFS